MPSTTGVGPNQSDDAIQVRISARACSSPARLAWAAARSHASAAAAARASFQCSHASSLRALQRPCWSSQRSKTGTTVSHRARGLLGCSLRDAQELQELLLDERVRVGALVAGGTRLALRFGEDVAPLPQPAGLDERRAELRRAAALRLGSSTSEQLRLARAGRSPREGRCARAPGARPTRAARERARRALASSVGRAERRRGSDTPARGDSRRSPRTRGGESPAARRARRRTARAGSARVAFESES